MRVPAFAIIVISFMFCCHTVYSQATNVNFERITNKDGLPQSAVNCIIQDKKGFMWFATYDGLIKYDGYTFKVYRNVVGNKNSLSNNGLALLYEDRDGYIWVTNNTKTGLDKFDPVTETVTRYKNDPNDSTSISSNDIFHVMQDKSGNIWVCAVNALNLVVNEKRGDKILTRFRRFYSKTNFAYTNIFETRNGRLLLFGDYLYYFDRKTFKINRSIKLNDSLFKHSISEDKFGNLWLGTHATGITKLAYNKQTQSYEYSILNKINVTPKNRNYVVIDDKERIWIATQTKGLFKYDIKEDRLDNFLNDKTDITSISDNSINCLSIDRSGVLWIGTYSKGLCKIDLYKKTFIHYKSIVGDEHSLSGNAISSIHSTKPGELWVSLDAGGGIDRFIFDRDKVQQVIQYKNNPYDYNSIPSNSIFCLVQRKNGEVWTGGIDGFVTKIIPEKPGSNKHPIIKAYKLVPWTFSIYEDRDGIIWGGTWFGGLWRYNDKTDKFVYYLNDPANPKSLCDNIIWAITEDNSGNIWIGGHGGGLSILPAKEKRKLKPEFANFKQQEENVNSLSNNTIHAIFQDTKGTMWIGTSSGLNKVIINDNNFNNINSNSKIEFTAYHMKDGLPSENIVGILEDNTDNLWISTSNGLSKFNCKNDSITNYYESDGLQGNEFAHNAYFKDQNGKMYFGGFNGISAFDPDSIKPNPFRPNIVITDIKMFNKSVQIGEKINGDIILNKSINYTSKITLSHKNNVFTLVFAALHYSKPEKNQYAFMLEGFEKEWNYVGNKREATYTNLNPGKYTFHVKASNNDGIWNETGTTLEIIILPPWWKTWWFKLLAAIGFLLLIRLFFYYRIENYKRRQRELTELINQRTQDLKNINEQLLKEQAVIVEQQETLRQTNFSLQEQNQRIEEYAEETNSHNEELKLINEQLLEKQTKIEEQSKELNARSKNLKEVNELLVEKQNLIQLQAKTLEESNRELLSINSTKDRLFSIIAHDLRNPFHAVSGFSEILMRDYNRLPKEKIDRYLDLINKSSATGSALLENLLQWSRAQTGRIVFDPINFDLYTISKEITDLLEVEALRKNIRIQLQVEQDLIVFADDNMIKTVLRNLISNAIKFTSENGRITITTQRTKSHVEVNVSDTGVGIAPENIGLLFKVDTNISTKGTASEPGTGLGLILCKEFVERNGGTIWVESQVDHGSQFKFTLQLANNT